MEEKYIIYAHINIKNGKTYVGQTKQTLSRRWRKEGEGYKKCTNFYNAIQLDGWESFKHIILFENLTLQEADIIEEYLIEKFDLRNEEKGYNIAKGGGGFPQIASNIISEKNKEKWKNGIYDNIKTKVYCIELNKEFESALKAEEETGIDNSSIQKACKNKIKYAGFSPKGDPLHWIYLENKNNEIIKKLYFKKEIIKGTKIPVYCPELDELFTSTEEVYLKYKIDPSSIRKVIRGVQQSAGKHPMTNEKLHWKQREDLIQNKNKISQEQWDKLLVK